MSPAAKAPDEEKQKLAREARRKFLEDVTDRIGDEAERFRREVTNSRDAPEEKIGFMRVYSGHDKHVKEDSPLLKVVEKREREKANDLFSGLGRHEIVFRQSSESMLVDVGRVKGLGDDKTFKVTSIEELRKSEQEMILRQPAQPNEGILKTKPGGRQTQIK